MKRGRLAPRDTGDGAVAVVCLLVGFRANDKGCRCDKLSLEVLSRSSARIRGVPVLAYEPFGICVVHLLHEVSLRLRCHGCFADAQNVAESTEMLGQVHITDFVWLDPQVRVVHAEQVPDVEARIGDFTVRQETLRLHSV